VLVNIVKQSTFLTFDPFFFWGPFISQLWPAYYTSYVPA
jgi:hypothetical protein